MPKQTAAERAQLYAEQFAQPLAAPLGQKQEKPSHKAVQEVSGVSPDASTAERLQYLGDLVINESINQFEVALRDESSVQSASLSQARQILERVGVLDIWQAEIKKAQESSVPTGMDERLLKLVGRKQ
ncbi:hypothetical protein EXU30_19700 [Shewanella maritima]|uniref:Uncharacterized protein n=1 Tax=Shewanella maritima TaxID=2520507 RepID=A0A411PM80_9GAMM|nr:hypothetical protein [Shewanella maritima]QBF84650.1 hypothetical protein EXU30_19700 [Shewanella maritima]